MTPIRVTLIASAMAVLGGCVAVPVDRGYYGQPHGYYGAPYYEPAYYGPSIGIGIFGGSRYHRHGWRDHDHDRHDGRRDGDGRRWDDGRRGDGRRDDGGRRGDDGRRGDGHRDGRR